MGPLATLWVLSLGAVPADAPLRERAWILAAATEVPQSLVTARKLADQLRFEEAVVEYQRYLIDANRPVAERARALLELSFLHLVLADEQSARKRAFEALELDSQLQAGKGAPQKQTDFLAQVRRELLSRPKLEVLPRSGEDTPQQVKVQLVDPERRVQRLWLRHSPTPTGPFYGQVLRCPEAKEGGRVCVGEIPPPSGSASYSAWYYAEALDEQGNTLARSASPSAPLQLSVIERSPWYKSPWIWGGGAALVIAVGAVVFVTSSAPQK